MEKTMEKAAGMFAALCLLCAVVAGCSSPTPKLSDCPVMPEEEFGGVYVDISIDDFNKLGFAFGDSVDVEFSNGYKLESLPYYTGYFTQAGEPLLIAYPGYPHIKVCINNGDDMWKVAGLTENDKASITLNKRGAFFDIQDARDLRYEDDRQLFESDEEFANFRDAEAGNISANTLYRSASPCDDQHERAPYADTLIEQAGVKYILDLADTDEKIAGYRANDDVASPYFLSLYDQGMVVPLGLNTNFESDAFRGKLATGLTAMADHSGPYLVHCTEGKDRTGYVCMLLEMLCGASYDEIVSDYMITYDNYYSITSESDPKRYNIIVEEVLDPMIKTVVGDDSVDIKTASLAEFAETYLAGIGMDAKRIAALKSNLAGVVERDESIHYLVYEAVFLDNDEVVGLFKQVRGEEPPYEKTPEDYHVTTAFFPEADTRDLYGTEVTLHITGYKAGEVTDDNGSPTQNEGFAVEILTESPELEEYLASQDANWHITGSFTDAAKYTGHLDFSDAQPVDFTIKGYFGAYLNGGLVTNNGADVDTPIEELADAA